VTLNGRSEGKLAKTRSDLGSRLPPHRPTERVASYVATLARTGGISKSDARQAFVAEAPAGQVGVPDEFGATCASWQVASSQHRDRWRRVPRRALILPRHMHSQSRSIGFQSCRLCSIPLATARELTAIVERRGKPGMIVSDHGTEFICNAMLAWSKDTVIDWHFIAPAKPMQNGFIESFSCVRRALTIELVPRFAETLWRASAVLGHGARLHVGSADAAFPDAGARRRCEYGEPPAIRMNPLSRSIRCLTSVTNRNGERCPRRGWQWRMTSMKPSPPCSTPTVRVSSPAFYASFEAGFV
jgi:hypothetical protein